MHSYTVLLVIMPESLDYVIDFLIIFQVFRSSVDSKVTWKSIFKNIFSCNCVVAITLKFGS